MYKKNWFLKSLVLSILLIFVSNFSVFAAENTNNKWVKFTIDVPDDIIFDYNVAIELKDINMNTVNSYSIDSTDNYISYNQLNYGTYIISSVVVNGEYEGYFQCGFSKDSFDISVDSEDITEIPIVIEFSYSNSIDSGQDNFEIETPSKDEEINTETIDSTIDNSNNNVVDDVSDDEKLTIEDKISQEEEENNKKISENQRSKNDSLLPSFLLMCIILLSGGIVFYILKKKNSV